MVIRDILRAAPCARLDAEVLLAHILGKPRSALLLGGDTPVGDADYAAFTALAAKRAKGCPVSYLTGTREFFSMDFFVTSDTLIPRPDTELLVEWALPHAAQARVLDICCGSGCIGLAIAEHAPVASLTLTDISEKALAVAAKNAAMHGINATFTAQDILAVPPFGTYDLIVSNPPYIETEILQTLTTDVRDFEPLLALDGGNDGLLFYPTIIEKSATMLAPGGFLAVEIGYLQGSAVSTLFQPYFSNIQVLQDLAGHDRVVCGQVAQ